MVVIELPTLRLINVCVDYLCCCGGRHGHVFFFGWNKRGEIPYWLYINKKKVFLHKNSRTKKASELCTRARFMDGGGQATHVSPPPVHVTGCRDVQRQRWVMMAGSEASGGAVQQQWRAPILLFICHLLHSAEVPMVVSPSPGTEEGSWLSSPYIRAESNRCANCHVYAVDHHQAFVMALILIQTDEQVPLRFTSVRLMLMDFHLRLWPRRSRIWRSLLI